MSYQETPARVYAPGMGEAVANRTINRKITRPVPLYFKRISIPRRDDMALDKEVAEWCLSNNLVIDHYDVPYGDDVIVEVILSVVGVIEIEKWEDVAKRVAEGNAMLHPLTDTSRQLGKTTLIHATEQYLEFTRMHHHLRQASILMSGRHLQHGDDTQPTRPMEVFTNCSTAAANFLSFYLMLNGSGVGRSYDDAMMRMDFKNLPIVTCVCDQSHKDIQSGLFAVHDRRTAEHLYSSRKIHVFEVPDSREGWAKALEKMELMAFQKIYREDVLLLDFSGVRAKGTPIKGMQNRPASGPAPLMAAIANIARLREAGMSAWRGAMYADHYAAECVLVGGARRAARMSTKTWRDKSVLEFIAVKRGGFLWTSNNSVTVDQEFWDLVKTDYTDTFGEIPELAAHAKAVFDAICEASYKDGTGEPGLITVDKLTWVDEGTDVLFDGNFAESARYKLDTETLSLTAELAKAWQSCRYKVITNPCGEIVLSAIGGYCVLASVVPFHAVAGLDGPSWRINPLLSQDEARAEVQRLSDDDAEDAFRVATRALIRTNLMDSLYSKEVKRTNRIGVALVGLHEYAWARFGYGWKDLIDEAKSADFWQTLSRFKRAVQDEAEVYARLLGVVVPHSDTTMVPAGTISKLFGLTEGAHLPSMREFLRWVQFRNDDPLIDAYRAKGYPVRKLQTYAGTTIVGFPTQPTICSLGMGDKLVTAAEATPEEQYHYLRLLEKYWITGVAEDGVTPLRESGNQVSYTLKYDPKVVSFEDFKRTLLAGQSTIRCCSVMPQTDDSAYEYQPEEPTTKAQYELIVNALKSEGSIQEDIGLEHVDCSTGSCPISFGENVATA